MIAGEGRCAIRGPDVNTDSEMPELPDVETFRRYVQSTALRKRIADVAVPDGRILSGVGGDTLRAALRRTSFTAAERHGKYLFAATDGGPNLVLHFGMTGYPAYEKQRNEEQYDRVHIRFENDYVLAYVCRRLLGMVGLADSREAFVAEQGLGPDALDISEEEFAAGLAGSGGAVKPKLMDQGFIAGIGNIYADEILFHARLAPRRRCRDMDKDEIRRLYRTMRRILRTAADRGADPGKMPRTWLLPHRREAGCCPRCGAGIVKETVSGRSAYRCPACQRA